MYGLLTYSLETGLCLAVFYLFYKLLLSRETLHRFNRIVVLALLALSFALPLCRITVERELPAAEAAAPAAAYAIPAVAADPDPDSWRRLAAALYLAGVAVALGRTLRSIVSILSLVRRGRRERLDDGTLLICLPEAIAPCSWGRYILLSEADRAAGAEAVILHERAHLRLHHTCDLLAADLAGCLQWFNPAMRLLRRELRALHEYEADEAVLAGGIDARCYQLLLVQKAAGKRWCSLADGFNQNKLKNRIAMMTQKRSSRWAGAKALFVLPLTALALGAFARTVYILPEPRIETSNAEVEMRHGKQAPRLLSDSPAAAPAAPAADKAPAAGEAPDSSRTARVKAGTATFYIDGREVPEEELRALHPNRISTMSIIKGDDAIVSITTGDGEPATGSQIVTGGLSGRVVRIHSSGQSSDTLELESAALFRYGKESSGKMQHAQYIIDGQAVSMQDAGELLTAENIASTTITKSGEEYTVRIASKSAGSKAPQAHDEETGATQESAPATPSDVLSADVPIYIDGQRATKEEMLSLRRIRRMQIYKGDEAVKRYGEQARGGVIDIRTRKR